MALETYLAETGTLICDDVEVGGVELWIRVCRHEETGRTTAAGHIRAGESVLQCHSCKTAVIVTRHFGRIMIQIHRIDDQHAYFDVVEPVPTMGVHAREAPSLDHLDGGHDARLSINETDSAYFRARAYL